MRVIENRPQKLVLLKSLCAQFKADVAGQLELKFVILIKLTLFGQTFMEDPFIYGILGQKFTINQNFQNFSKIFKGKLEVIIKLQCLRECSNLGIN